MCVLIRGDSSAKCLKLFAQISKRDEHIYSVPSLKRSLLCQLFQCSSCSSCCTDCVLPAELTGGPLLGCSLLKETVAKGGATPPDVASWKHRWVLPCPQSFPHHSALAADRGQSVLFWLPGRLL